MHLFGWSLRHCVIFAWAAEEVGLEPCVLIAKDLAFVTGAGPTPERGRVDKGCVLLWCV